MLWLLLAVPVVAGLVALVLPWSVPRRMLLLLTSLSHAGLTATCLLRTPPAVWGGWLALDPPGRVFLAVTSFLFLVVTIYTVGYLVRDAKRAREEPDRELPFADAPEAIFTGCYLLFLGAMTGVIVSQHWGLMWVAVEATTLASAPLIYFHRHARSLEATWKYLLICSVGIALALLGNFFLAVAVRGVPGGNVHLSIACLESHAGELNPLWLRAAFLLLLVGYGTKMGLAPLHTWLPDAHSEAPSMVSALLSGVLLNCAFLAVLRGHALLAKAGMAEFSQDLLVLFGLLSLAVAAVFIINQRDYKRLLAYSSVEHMGILALGAGIGGVAGFGCLLHAVNHSVAKALLFLAAGNTLAWSHTKSTLQSRGVKRVLPGTALLWLIGLFAISGSPPFGTFLSEFTILKGIVDAGRWWVCGFYLGSLSVIFVGMSAVILPMVYGEPTGSEARDQLPPELQTSEQQVGLPAQACAIARRHEPLWSLAPPLLLAAIALVLGVYVPPQLSLWLQHAAASLGAYR